MESIIECIVCLEPYNSFDKVPLILTCGHTLCKECVVKINSNSADIKCPIDRKVEPKATKQLTVNYAILQLLNLHKSGIPSRETCTTHSHPITLICKTCSLNCCYKCIRNHAGHDVYEADHPIIVSEVEVKVKHLADKIENGLDTSVRSCERIKKELRELTASQNKLRNEMNSAFDYFAKQLEMKRQESLELLDSKFHDKEEFLNSCFCEAEMHVKHYENYSKDIEQIRKQIKDKNYVDRAVTCGNMLKKMMIIQFPNVRDINNNNLRLSLDSSYKTAFCIPVIQVNDYSPAEVLDRTYILELEELQSNYQIYSKLGKEHKLSLEVSCSSLYTMTQHESLVIAKLHLLNYCCWEVLQQDYMGINDALRKKLLEKAGLPKNVNKIDYALSAELLSKIRYVKAMIWAFSKVANKQWEDALITLHCVIMKENQFDLAEEALGVLLLRMCSFSYASIRAYQVIDSLPIVQLITRYLKFHVLSSNVLYKQVVFHLKYAFDYVKNSLPDFFFPFFQQRYGHCLQELEENSAEGICCEYPPELLYNFNLLNEDSVRFWKDKALAQRFIESFQGFRESLSPWYQALVLIRDRREILQEAEFLVLERS